VIGVVFLVIVLLSPGGLLGIWEWLKQRAVNASRLNPAAGEGRIDTAPTPPA
jgi:hypothetical protein